MVEEGKARNRWLKLCEQSTFEDDGEKFRSLVRKPVDYTKSAGMALLTPREEEVVNLVVQGMKNREIALELRVTEHTISNYLYRIFEKVGVSGRVELVLQTVSHRSQS